MRNQTKINNLINEVNELSEKWRNEINEIVNESEDYKFASNFSYNRDKLEQFVNTLNIFKK